MKYRVWSRLNKQSNQGIMTTTINTSEWYTTNLMNRKKEKKWAAFSYPAQRPVRHCPYLRTRSSARPFCKKESPTYLMLAWTIIVSIIIWWQSQQQQFYSSRRNWKSIRIIGNCLKSRHFFLLLNVYVMYDTFVKQWKMQCSSSFAVPQNK